MISRSKENAIPTVHDTTAAGLKLTVVQLTIRLHTELKEKSWLFFYPASPQGDFVTFASQCAIRHFFQPYRLRQ